MTREDAVNKVTRSAQGAWQWVTRIPNTIRIQALDRQLARELAVQRAATKPLRQRQEELVLFYDRYERLVETICDSAQYGPEPKLESRYADARQWMLANYPEMKPYVLAYLKFELTDATFCNDPHGKMADAFEALFTSPTLAAFLLSDDGSMIERIMRTRDAIQMYSDHLKMLIAQEKA